MTTFTNLWSAAPCPRCGAALERLSTPGYAVQACKQCNGAWIDDAGVSALVAGAGETIALPETSAVASPNATPAGGRCPTCHGPLSAVTVYDGRIALDFCAGHGIWFDASEVDAVRKEARAKREATAGDPGAQTITRADVAAASVGIVEFLLDVFLG